MIGKIIRFLTPIVIVIAAAGIVFLLVKNKPVPVKATAFSVAPMVTVQPIEKKDAKRWIHGKGNVIPARQVTLNTQVAGRIVERHPALEPGGFVQAGEALVMLERADYELAIEAREAQVAKARLALEVELGRQRVAEREWELIQTDSSEVGDGAKLALRKPQVKAARAELKGAQSALKQARLNLERTTLVAPFSGFILQRSAELGQQVTPQTPVVTLVDSSRFWVETSITQEELALLESSGNGEGGPVKVTSASGVELAGTFLRALPQIEMKGRMAQVLIEVRDPMAQESGKSRSNSLPLGTYVSVDIEAGIIPNAMEIPRIAMTDQHTVWVVGKDSALEEVPVTLLSTTKTSLIVDGKLSSGDSLVVSPIAGPIAGMKVQTRDEADSVQTSQATPDSEKGNTAEETGEQP